MDGLNRRGHPRRSLWSAFYLAAVVMGILYLTDIAQTRSLAGATDNAAAYSWQISLLVGGLAGLAGNLAPRHRYRSALTIEASGALVTAAMVAIYVGFVIFAPATNIVPYATIMWMSAVVLALAGRAVEAFQQRQRAIEYAAARAAIRDAAQG